eukprot:CAMPEP_0197886888 /NCGR_PEP_ID=MMETSP1439-20131203/18213_1 /TAXON_ID=66791 /ORGANISM="Gonyaulax spinifera, Strain CCMP409" /LENGTH=83 /DNA_ID=CAMNT_0043506707 /DNA_START=84 /DNA_END=333 /DNA_ORIENTATION=+
MWMFEGDQQRVDPVKLAMDELFFKLKFGFVFCLTIKVLPTVVRMLRPSSTSSALGCEGRAEGRAFGQGCGAVQRHLASSTQRR